MSWVRCAARPDGAHHPGVSEGSNKQNPVVQDAMGTKQLMRPRITWVPYIMYDTW